MPLKFPRPKSSRAGTLDELQPLLKPLAPNAIPGIQPPDLEAATAAPGESDTYRAWKVFLFLVISVCFNTVLALVTKNEEEGEELTYMMPSGQIDAITSPRFAYERALWRALGGGVSGAAATIVQVLTLMPLRTTLNYQHRHSTTASKAIKTLHSSGGYSRYYQGLVTALVFRTWARFGDTASNAGVLALLGSNVTMGALPILVQTIFASLCATVFRFIFAPLDTVGTAYREQGRAGLKTLRRKVKDRGITYLWTGAMAGAAISFVEHYFWYGTYNYLREIIPLQYTQGWVLARRAFIGFCASLVSYATLFPVVAIAMMYLLFHGVGSGDIKNVREIIVADGGLVLFGRGWQLRILERGLQGIVFAVLWNVFLDLWNDNI